MSNFYNSNFDDSAFRNKKTRGLNKTIDDPCAIQQRNADNSKKLKFVTTNHADLLNAKSDMNFFGTSIKDQLFVPSEKVDVYSNLLNGNTGSILTNCNVKTGFGQLPLPTLPSQYQLAHGDVDIEDSIRNLQEINRKSCNPRENEFYNRSFTLFFPDQNIEIPDANKSVDTNEMGPRGGISTRFELENPKQ
jgi:hypothetical protein